MKDYFGYQEKVLLLQELVLEWEKRQQKLWWI